MKKKISVVASAVAAIAVCFVLIVGGTFALFTSRSEVNIAVTTGKVDVTATVSNLKVYSAVAAEDGEIVDEYGATYEYAEQADGSFVNGGAVTLQGNSITLSGMTAGDKITFDVTVTNSSTVGVLYRTLFSTSGDEVLRRALSIKIGEENLTKTGEYVTRWSALDVPAAGTVTIATYTAEIYLPITDTSNNGGECGIAYAVEAVQSNASVDDAETRNPLSELYFVTPDTINEYLSGEHGSISNATIVLTPGNYGQIVLGSPSKYAGGDTVYYCSNAEHENQGIFTDSEEFVTHCGSAWHHTPTYTRTIENLKIVGQEGVTVEGLSASSGHVYGDNILDPVKDTVGNGSRYFMIQKLRNITFENISFTQKVIFETSQAETVIDGVTFENCSFTTGGTAAANGQGLRYYNENDNGNVRNLTVNNCSFANCYQGIYTSKINGVTVTNCVFDTTGHNAIAVQSVNEIDHKAVVITGNVFKNVADRIIRFNKVGADTQITIKNNTATNCGDDANDVMKATSLAEGVTYDISGNDWGEGRQVSNEQLRDR